MMAEQKSEKASQARQYRTPYDYAICIHTMVPNAAYVLEHYTVDGAKQYIWTCGKLRKDNRCSRCGNDPAKGGTAFRPMTFKDERGNRLCQSCIEDIIAGREREVP